MSTGVLRNPEWLGAEAIPTKIDHLAPAAPLWNLESFEHEQIRGLVRRVFFSDSTRPVHQVVFSPADPETDVRTICKSVGLTLALETPASIVVVCRHSSALDPANPGDSSHKGAATIRERAQEVRPNLWLISDRMLIGECDPAVPAKPLDSHLCELRRDFQYSVIEAAHANQSSAAASLGQLADGIILVLAAHRTRRVIAQQIKQSLDASRVRLLGTVLSERRFPIPEGIYRRL